MLVIDVNFNQKKAQKQRLFPLVGGYFNMMIYFKKAFYRLEKIFN